MLDIYNSWNILTVETSTKNKIFFNTDTLETKIDEDDFTYPGEYEKSGILLEVKEYNGVLFYHFVADTKNVVIVTSDSFELKEEILSFFGNVDVLIIKGSKEAAKIFENIEALVVVPYGEAKDLFLNAVSQHSEEVSNFKVKADQGLDNTEFVNLKI